MRWRFFQIGNLLLVAWLTSGCVGNGLVLRAPDKNHPEHVRYWVLGFGLITVETPKAPAATVVQARSLGLQVSDSPAPRLALGYNFSHTTLVPEQSEIVLEVEQRPFRPPTVATLPAKEQPEASPVSHANDTPTTSSPGG